MKAFLRSAALRLLLCAWLVGCIDDGECNAPRTNATDHPLIRSRPDDLAAVSARVSDAPPHVDCSASWIERRWLVTSRHCDAEQLWIQSGASLQSADWTPVIDRVKHPDLDVMLLGVAQPTQQLLSWSALDPSRVVGARTLWTGFGRQPNGESGAFRVIQGEIVSVSDDQIEVTPDESVGPCAGDSGGALLVDSDDEGWKIVGLLHAGALFCRGPDFAVRADRFADWVEDQTNSDPRCDE